MPSNLYEKDEIYHNNISVLTFHSRAKKRVMLGNCRTAVACDVRAVTARRRN